MVALSSAAYQSTEAEFRRLLEARVAAMRAEWRAAHEQRADAERRIAELRRYVALLNPILVQEGIEPFGDEGGGAPAGVLRLMVGNRSDTMPPRRAACALRSLTDAIADVLASGEQFHADEIAAQLYEIRGRADLLCAKRSLVSALARGVKARRWRRADRPNTYRRND